MCLDKHLFRGSWGVSEVPLKDWGSLSPIAMRIILRNPATGTKITCSNATEERDHQLWIFDRAAIGGPEIRAILQKWKPDLPSRLLLPHRDDAEWVIRVSQAFRP